MSCRLGALQHHYAPHAVATAIPAVHEPDIYNDFNGSHSAAPTAAPATKLQTTKELATDRVLQMIERRGLPLPISVELALETFTSSVDDRLIRHENLAQIDLKNLLRAEMQIGVDTPEPTVLTRRGGICWLKRVGKALGSVPQAVYDSCALGFVVYAETDPNNFLAFFELTPHATNDTKWSARDIRTGETFAAVSLLLPVPLQANFFKILQQRPDIRYSGVLLSGDRGAAQEMIVRVPDELLHSTGRETFEILRNLMETLYRAPTKTQRGLDTFAKHFVEWLVRKVPGWAEGKIPDDFISCATAAWISVATLTTAPAEQAPVFETSATTSEQCLEPIDQQAVDMQVHGCLKGCGLMLSRRSEDSPREREYDLVDRKLTEVKRVRRDELNPECCCVVELKYKHFGCKHASWSNPTPVAHLCCLDQKPFHVGCRLWQHRSFADCETNPELSTMPAPGEA